MKKEIKFGNRIALLERSKSVGSLIISPAMPDNPVPSELAEIADAINADDFIDVHTIITHKGEIAFRIDKGCADAVLVDFICDVLASVFESDITV